MIHDKNLHKQNLEQNLEQDLAAFTLLGEGVIAYVKSIKQEELEMPQDAGEVSFAKALGVYSAGGQLLAVCDGPASAFHFVAEHDLLIANLH